jgi:hypothetical protein
MFSVVAYISAPDILMLWKLRGLMTGLEAIIGSISLSREAPTLFCPPGLLGGLFYLARKVDRIAANLLKISAKNIMTADTPRLL